MFMLSFILLEMGGLFEGKRIFAGFFYRLFMYVLPLEVKLSRGAGCDPINRFNTTTMLCLFHAMFVFLILVEYLIIIVLIFFS